MLKNCIDVKNYDGVRIIFTNAQREAKSKKHPELREDSKLKHYYFIIAAYRPDFVKERGKTKLLYGKDNE